MLSPRLAAHWLYAAMALPGILTVVAALSLRERA